MANTTPEIVIEMNNDIINELNPTQEHFLKKYLLENRLTHELHLLSQPNCCQLFGPPFKYTPDQMEEYQFPLLRFFSTVLLVHSRLLSVIRLRTNCRFGKIRCKNSSKVSI